MNCFLFWLIHNNGQEYTIDTLICIKKISYDQKHTSIIQNYYRIRGTHTHTHTDWSDAAAAAATAASFSSFTKKYTIIIKITNILWRFEDEMRYLHVGLCMEMLDFIWMPPWAIWTKKMTYKSHHSPCCDQVNWLLE